ncbi:cupin superfamily protein [Herbihabitans rhizosphaerae]|uniref:Cupin superfamily protein n=1 Tax=Herbihabitans rhizosphaerae TaxID=1872711 RepID=A0A4Q7KEN5_9PSEU|nr:cupin domain-containing protein [Herbihabitans rhizosphaerae]RZS30510.1 cupin superfamily protein [Herbihabitans rhizosphaerae]
MVVRLAHLLAPQSAVEFIRTIYGRNYAHFSGEAGRFASLADWGALNNLLATQRFAFPRLRLAKQGDIVPEELYTEQVDTSGHAFYRRILTGQLVKQLRDGATLVIDRVDQAHQPLAQLASTLESEMRARVFVNLYASWGAAEGFGTHWDDHDVFVLQLDGHKRWKIFEPTRMWPLRDETAETPKPQSPPIAEFDLMAGDVLYLPHGWWHAASPCGQPSLHLSVGVAHQNGIDFVKWLTGIARDYEIFRQRVPLLGGDSARNKYLASIRGQLNELMNSDSVLDRFVEYSDGVSPGRPLFKLPDIGEQNTILENLTAEVVLLAPKATSRPNRDGDGFVLTALGRRWMFAEAARPIIDMLISGDGVTVQQVVESSPHLGPEQAADVVYTLLNAGVVAIQ